MKKENIIIAAFLGLLVVAAIIMLTQKKAVVTNPNGTTGTQTANSLGGSIADFFGGLFKPSTSAGSSVSSGGSVTNWITRQVVSGSIVSDEEIGVDLANYIQENPADYGLTYADFEAQNPYYTSNGFSVGSFIVLPRNINYVG